MEKLLDFLKIFEYNPYISIVIYKEKIIYANETFSILTGYTQQELLKMAPEDFFPNKELRIKIRNTINKRLKGEEFYTPYPDLEIVTKNKKRTFIKFLSATVKCNHEYCGLALILNVSDEIIKNKYIDILKETSEIIITMDDEENIFWNIVKIIKEFGNFQFVSINIKRNNQFKPIYNNGHYDINLLDFIENTVTKDIRIYNHLNRNDFFHINNIQNSKLDQTVKQKFKNYNYNSFLIIPIFRKNSLFCFISIFSKYINDFDNGALKVFEELKINLELAFTKIQNNAYLKLLQEALDKAYSWVIITDERNKIIYANKSVEEISGYTIDEILNHNPNIFKSNSHSQNFYRNIWQKLNKSQVVETYFINRKKNGDIFYLKSKIIPITANGKKYYIALSIDLTKEKILQDKLKYDSLTNLLNRDEFISVIDNRHKNRSNFACIVLDINDFKIYNQLHGNKKGDKLLQTIANKLKKILSDKDIIARIGGDEFAICSEFKEKAEVSLLANNIIYSLKNLKELQNKVSFNIGISLYPEHSKNTIELIEKAYIALKKAKSVGDFSFKIYKNEFETEIRVESNTKDLLIRALEKKAFIYHFQPYFDAKNATVTGAETLIRIQFGSEIIYPDKFIDFAENSGYIKEIEKVMFPKFLDYLKEIKIPLSFNISGKSLADPNHIKQLFRKISNLPITIELTEREVAGNIEYAKDIFNYFKNKNLKLAIDDFGTGYSSLTYLKNLPADFIKIDMSFIQNIEHSKTDLAIVETINTFAHKLNLKTIVEGVETKTQKELLKSIDSDYFQGYFFAKPMPFEKIKKFIENLKFNIN